MIITCPSCQARYPVDPAAFAPAGRKVRCKKCGHVWRQGPLESEAPRPAASSAQSELGLQPEEPVPTPESKIEPAPEPASIAQDVQEPPASEGSDSDSKFEAAPIAAPIFEQAAGEQKRSRQEPEGRDVQIVMAETVDAQAASGSKLRNFVQGAALSRRLRLRDIAIWTALFAIIVATALFFFFYNENPWLNRKTAAVQEAVGQPVNLRGIEFRNVSYERQTENGLPVLAVRGEVLNIADEARVLPPLRVGLSDGGDPPRELYHWTFTLPEKELAPQQSVDFVTRLSSPPADARDLEVRFVLPGEELGPSPASDGTSEALSDPAAP